MIIDELKKENRDLRLKLSNALARIAEIEGKQEELIRMNKTFAASTKAGEKQVDTHAKVK